MVVPISLQPTSPQQTSTLPKFIKGTGISPGVARGVLFSVSVNKPSYASISISKKELQGEVARFSEAVQLAIQQLESLDSVVSQARQPLECQLLQSHLELLKDPNGIQQRVTKLIHAKKKCVEESLLLAVKKLQREFRKATGLLRSPRFQEVEDVAFRIMDCLKGQTMMLLEAIPDGAIVYTDHLSLSVAFAIAQRAKGFIAASGSAASHAAIFARARAIPFITGIAKQELEHQVGSEVEIDGGSGILSFQLDDSKTSLDKAQVVSGSLPFALGCGYPLEISVNVEHESYILMAQREGVKKIGLLRTEYFFLDHEQMPSKNTQVKKLRQLVAKSEMEHTIVRVFDVSWDKFPGLFKKERGVAFLLKHQKKFRQHLQAIFTAMQQPFSLLLPFVNSAHEIKEAKSIIDEEIQGFPISIGAMIETPWAILQAEEIIHECDFISIGSNDLLQYSLGIDRSSAVELSQLAFHQGILELLLHVQQVIRTTKKPCNFCGEMAADPRMLPILIGMGFTSFSMSPQNIPAIRRLLKGLQYDELIAQVTQWQLSKMVDRLKKLREVGVVYTS